MKFWTAIVFLFVAQGAFSQRWPFEYWHDGKLITESGDTLKGKIKYDIQTDIIQLDQKGKLQSFTGRKAIYYEIFDATSGRYRKFYSLPYSPSGGYKSPVYFELLSEGKLTLLSKEALEYRNYSTGYGFGTVSRLVLVNKYFTLEENGGIIFFSGRKPDLMALMDNRDEEVKKFIKGNRLDIDNKYDLARTFEYYNSLFVKK